ncbi:MAG TPA: hypothetical protein VIH37_12445, partial [Candidatus Limnocylindrales bacterium]
MELRRWLGFSLGFRLHLGRGLGRERRPRLEFPHGLGCCWLRCLIFRLGLEPGGRLQLDFGFRLGRSLRL